MSETMNRRHRVILAATDFSAAAERAVEWAVDLAIKRRAELRLVHAVVRPGTTAVAPELARALTEELVKQARHRLEETALPLRWRVPALACEVETGAPAEVILAAIAKHRPELVVVGTRGLRDWRHVLLGSTAARVLGRAACPVVGVHEGDPNPPERPLRLLVATDFSADAEEAANTACRLLAGAVEEVVLLHAFSAPLPAPPAEVFAYGDFVGTLRQRAREALEEQAARVRMLGVAARTELREGFAPEVIAAAASALRADVVVMGSRSHGGVARLLLGSCAEQALRLVRCPLLLLPRRAWQEAKDATEAASQLVPAAVDEEC